MSEERKSYSQARVRGILEGDIVPTNPVEQKTVTVNVDTVEADAFADLMRVRDKVMSRWYGDAIFGEIWSSPSLPPSSEAAETPRRPPASYTAARDKVEQWLITAPEQAFDDIVGNDEALEQLRDAIQAPVTHKELYEGYGMTMPKGALLYGGPGNGKTMFARAAASEMQRLYGDGVEFLCINGAELQGSYVGQTEGRIKAIFTFAREYAAYHGHPLLVFMDEAEVLLPDRNSRKRTVHGFEEKQVASFLAEMDGIQDSGAFVLLATNRPEAIDQAVLRDGRCDFKIAVKRPNAEAIEAILRRGFDGLPLGDDGLEALVFTAAEGLVDPHRIILDARAIVGRMGLEGPEMEQRHRHFLLEHIVSGAMVASIPERAKRAAFARDKAAGVMTGISVADVMAAVSQVFEENKALDHAFAFNEFADEWRAEMTGKVS